MTKQLNGERALVIDLREVRSMSSVGLNLCIEARNHARACRGVTILLGVDPLLREQLRVLRIDRLYKMAADEQEVARLVA